MKKLFLVLALLILLPVSASAMDVTLAWDPNSETDLAGYRIYQGTAAGGPYTKVADVAVMPAPEYTVRNLVRGTRYYFVVTAFDSETPSLESGYSNEVNTNGGPSGPQGVRVKVVVEVQIP